MTERIKRVVIQQTQGVSLRVTVEVSCPGWRTLGTGKLWEVLWLDRMRLSGTRRRAIQRAREVCGAMTDIGIDSELVIRRVDGTVGERRTYGRDPKKVKG